MLTLITKQYLLSLQWFHFQARRVSHILPLIGVSFEYSRVRLQAPFLVFPLMDTDAGKYLKAHPALGLLDRIRILRDGCNNNTADTW